MATRIGALFVDLNLNTAKFIEELDKSRTKSTIFGVAVGNILADITRSALRLGADVAGAIPQAFLAAADSADRLGKSAERTGIAVETLSALQHQAQLADVNFDSLSTSVSRFTRNVGEAIAGNKEQAKTMRALGVDLEGVKSGTISVEQALFGAIDTLAETENQFQKVSLGTKAFGRGFNEIIPLVNEGSAGFAKARDEAESLGKIISGETAAAADRFGDNLDRLKAALGGVAIQLTGPLLQGFVALTDAMVRFATEGGRVQAVGAGIAEIIQGLTKATLTGAVAVTGFVGALSSLATEIQRIRLVGANAFNKLLPESIEVDTTNLEKGLKAREDQTLAIADTLQGILDLMQDVDDAFARGTAGIPAVAGKSGKDAGEAFTAGFESTSKEISSAIERISKESAKLSLNVSIDPAVRNNLEQELQALRASLREGLGEDQVIRIGAEFDELKQKISLAETFTKSLRPSDELNARIQQQLSLGTQLADVIRFYSSEILTANDAQRAMGQTVSEEMSSWEDVVRSQESYITRMQDIIQQRFQIAGIPFAIAQITEEFLALPPNIRETADAISELDVSFSDVIPEAAREVARVDLAFERLGLTSGFALSGIADQAKKDFAAISESGQASAAQITEAFVQTQEAVKASAEKGFGTWTKEQEKALKGAVKQLDEITNKGQDATERFQELAHTLSQGFEDAILRGKGLRDVLIGILEDIGRIILRSTITGPNGILGTLLSGLGAAVGGAFGGGAGSAGGLANAGLEGFAEGGDVQAGRPVLVGERMEELFVPETVTSSLGSPFDGGGLLSSIQESNQPLTLTTGISSLFDFARDQFGASSTTPSDKPVFIQGANLIGRALRQFAEGLQRDRSGAGSAADPGGAVQSGRSLLVGEFNPEIFVPRTIMEAHSPDKPLFIEGTNIGRVLQEFEQGSSSIGSDGAALPAFPQIETSIRPNSSWQSLVDNVFTEKAAPLPGGNGPMFVGKDGPQIFTPPVPGTIIPLDTPAGQELAQRMEEIGLTRATGGSVSPGSSFLVGERGAELYLPNALMSDSAGNNTIVVQQTNTFQGIDGDRRLAALLELSTQRAVQTTLTILREHSLRGS